MLDDPERAVIETPVEEEILRKWIALARRQPDPVFASEDVRKQLEERFTTLRAANGYNDDSPVPVTFRKLEGTIRIAEAAATFELSEEITQRHADIATEHVGRSMQDYGKNEEGDLDADVQETGTS